MADNKINVSVELKTVMDSANKQVENLKTAGAINEKTAKEIDAITAEIEELGKVANPTLRQLNRISTLFNQLSDIIVNEPLSDVTFSGGDPMFQVEAFTELSKLIKIKTSKTIWLYSGYTYEQIKESPKMSVILPYIDVLVDGRYIDEKQNTDLKFRGSDNQRIIHLKNGEIDWIEV